MSLLYINLIPSSEQKTFQDKVNSVALKLLTNPDWLMQVMKAESGINPSIENTYRPMHNGNATGLIQFTPDTALNLGTTVAALKQMNRVDQMDYVYKYFKPYTGRLNSYFDIYLVTFFPAAIGKPDDWVIHTDRIPGSAVAHSNPTMDINKDGQITIAEFKQYLRNTVPAQYQDIVFKATDFNSKKNLS